MFYYLSGIIHDKKNEAIVIDVGGVGYYIFVTTTTLRDLPPLQEWVKLYTYFYVRDDEVSLYGFLKEDERNLFAEVLGVAGIGPRGALAILGTLSVSDFTYAVLNEDYDVLVRTP